MGKSSAGIQHKCLKDNSFIIANFSLAEGPRLFSFTNFMASLLLCLLFEHFKGNYEILPGVFFKLYVQTLFTISGAPPIEQRSRV